MIKLTAKLKKELFEDLGFQFKSNNTNYKDIFESIEFGEEFKRACEDLDLEAAIVEEYIKKYVFHLILEEATNFSNNELNLIRDFFDEPIFDTTIGELFEDIQNKIHYSQSEEFQSYLYGSNARQGKKLDVEEIDNLFKENEEYKNLTYPFAIRGNSLFSLYFKKYVNEQERPIKPRIDKNFDKESFTDDLITHYIQLTKLLYDYGNETTLRPTRDMLEFERETDLYFLLKVCSLLPKDDLEKNKYEKDKNNYLMVLASISIIEDLRLKLYFVEQFIKEDNYISFVKGRGYINLFLLIFKYIPLLKEYLLEQIKAPRGTLTIKSDDVTGKDEATSLKEIKRKLFLYQSLQGYEGYNLIDLKNEEIFQIDKTKINYSTDFIEFYKKTKKVNKFRKKFCKDAIDNIFEKINKRPELLEASLYNIVNEFVTQGKYLAIKSKRDSSVEETLKIFSNIHFDPDFIKETFNNVDIDIEKTFKAKN